MNANKRERLATESAEERAARLQQVSTTQHERHATESAEERAARLQQVSANQRERLSHVSRSLLTLYFFSSSSLFYVQIFPEKEAKPLWCTILFYILRLT